MFKPANPEACYGPFLEQRVIWLCWKHLASHCSHWAVCPSLSKSQWLGMVCGVAEALRENPPPISRVEVQPAQATWMIMGLKFSVLVSRRRENVCWTANNSCPFYFPFCSYLDRCLMKCVCVLIMPKFGVWNGGITKWGSGKGYAISLCGGRKNCMIIFFRWVVCVVMRTEKS